MAKFCGNCGAQLDDSARVCGHCGTPLAGTAAPAKGAAGKAPNKLAKVGVIAVAALAAILVVVIAFNIVSANTGYNGLTKTVMKAYEKYDLDAMVKVASGMYENRSEDSVKSTFKRTVNSALEAMENQVGRDYKFSYKVNDAYELTDRKLSNMMDRIRLAFLGADTSRIGKVAVAEITVTGKKSGKELSVSVQLTMSKEGKEWKLLFID